MLYTRKGDDGTTKIYGCDQQRMSKNSAIIEALGTVDELNSFIGLCKVKSIQENFCLNDKQKVSEIILSIQNNLFIVQAELASFEKTISEDKIKELELIIDGIEKQLPPIKTFFISGGTELATLFDISRTLTRKAERRVVGAIQIGAKIGNFTKAYLNRLSSIFYALARLANHQKDVIETAPTY